MNRAEGENRTLVLLTTTARTTIILQPPLFKILGEHRIKTLPEILEKKQQLEESSILSIMPTIGKQFSCHDFIKEMGFLKLYTKGN